MKLSLLYLALALLVSPLCWSQTADEIITTSIEKTGGKSSWAALQGIRIKAKFDQGGVEFPLEIVQLKDGRQYSKLTFQGAEIKQGVFDGKTLWSTDFQSLDPKLSDAETTENVKLDANDFPDSFINYRQKGYQAESIGKEQMNGSEVFKVKLIKEPITVNGQKYDDIAFYYFDSHSYLPVAREFEMKHGPIQGSTMIIELSDYREIGGLLFPFSMTQAVKGAPPQPITIESIELNPKINDDEFRFPK